MTVPAPRPVRRAVAGVWRTRRRSVGVLAALTAATLATGLLAGCSSSSGKVNLTLVAYSTPQAAYTQIIKAFQQTAAGKNVTFSTSYGASGDQSRAVDAGQPADVVAFSLTPDVTRLVKDGLIAKDWDQDKYNGLVTDSVVVIATRKGNPKHISDWPDLIKGNTEVISPNPFTSGGARWNVMAAYGATSDLGKDPSAGNAYLAKLFSHIPVQDDSARKALQTFTGGKGDAMIAYENDAIFAQQQGQPISYTIPKDTIKIENPAAVTSNSKHPKQAQAFLDYLHSAAAQKIYADNGYRPTTSGVSVDRTFPTPSGEFTINQLGGWTDVTDTFFDPDKGSLLAVEKKLGVSTSK